MVKHKGRRNGRALEPLCGLALWLFLINPGHAAETLLPMNSPSLPLACLTSMLSNKTDDLRCQGGAARVEMTFSPAQSAPVAKVLAHNGEASLANPVLSRFDLTAMFCPFQVAFAPVQPYADNVVEAGLRPDPESRAFVEGLPTIVLEIQKESMRTAIGVTSTIAVPCTVVDLT